ncbi:hypothetical protein FSP39_014445 [Pinctada imbricata]|uniref:Chitin-binding type-2 domain-containing protein n=1 Tax=Pinctada imbricata TaxID=66713 RepID=A0AA88YDP9_PINIB|nr:hypothetical protein FSP39_014445 [Pinctada imbricata]
MYLDECPYPKLFDGVTKRCQAFTQVKCGARKEVVDYCKYWKQTCLTMCSPCELTTPSCEGLSDGMHANPFKSNTPYFITCFRNRTTLTSMCGMDGFRRRKLFHSDQTGSGSCKSIYEIPQENGGKQPKCGSNAFTLHSDPSGLCSMYYFCLDGKPTVLECSKGKVFKNTLTEPVCQDPSNVCPPCGTKTEKWFVCCILIKRLLPS